MKRIMTMAPRNSVSTISPSLAPQSRSLSRAALAVVNAIMLVGAAQGQSTNAPAAAGSTNAPTQLPDVVVTGQTAVESAYKPETVASPKYVEPLRDTPQTINVVPRSVIEDQGATTLRDVLRNVPGISFQAGEGGVPAGDQLSIRGFSARTDLFVDGVRDIGGYTRDSFNVEQVEIFKGPNSAYSGRGSTGGAVNMVSKSPKLDAAYGATFGLGTDEYYRATADINQPIPQLEKIGIKGAAFRLNGVLHEQDFAGRDFIHDQRWAVNPTLAVGLDTPTRMMLSYLHLDEDNLPGYGLPFVSSSNNPYGGASAVGKIAPLSYDRFMGLANRDYEEIQNDIGRLRLEHDFNDDVTLRHQFSFGRTARDSILTAPRIITNPATNAAYNLVTVGANRYGLNHELQSRDQIDKVFSSQTDLTTRFETAKLEHTLVTSLEYNHETSLNHLRSAGVTPWQNGSTYYPAPLDNPYNPNPYSIFGPVSRTGAKNLAKSDAIGFSGFDTVKITEQWLLTLGLRADSFHVNYQQYSAAGALTNNLNRTDFEPTWRGGLVYKPRPNGSIYFGYGTSFNPSAEGLTLANNSVNVEPELGRSYELGTKWDLFDEKLSVSAALFRSDKENYRNTDPLTSIVSNSGDVRVEGIEFGISGQITKEWIVYGGYALMQSEILKSKTVTTYNGVPIREEGHQLSNTPEHTASLWTTYELPFHLSIGTGVSYVDKRFSNNIETSSVPGYWLQDALLSWQATKQVNVRLNVSNLWDEEYIDRVGGGHSIPGTGRTFVLSAAVQF